MEDIRFYSKSQEEAIGEFNQNLNLIPDVRRGVWILKRKQIIGQELVKQLVRKTVTSVLPGPLLEA